MITYTLKKLSVIMKKPISLFCILYFFITNINAQAPFSIGLRLVPAIFKSDERAYDYYFGKNNQFNLNYEAQFQYTYKGALAGIKIGVLNRKVEKTCVFIPNINDAPRSLDIIISSDSCTNYIEGKSTLIYIPLYFGFNILEKEKINIYISSGLGPVIQVNRNISISDFPQDNNEKISKYDSRLFSWSSIFLETGIEYYS